MPDYDYGCLMAPIQDLVASRLRGFSAALPDSRLYLDGSTHGREGEPHVTVLYGIEGEQSEALAEFEHVGPVNATLGAISTFVNDESIVLKVEVESEGLVLLNMLAKRLLRHKEGDFPDYAPHVTLAYLRHDRSDPEYYERYFCDIFNGQQVRFDSLLCSQPGGGRCLVPLVPGVAADEEAKRGKSVVVDFDGTITVDDQEFPKIGRPQPGVVAALTALRLAGYRIVVCTCRMNGHALKEGSLLERMTAIVLYLEMNGVPYDELAMPWDGKPFGDYYIDDHGLRFNGDWVGIQNKILRAETASVRTRRSRWTP